MTQPWLGTIWPPATHESKPSEGSVLPLESGLGRELGPEALAGYLQYESIYLPPKG